MAGCGGGGGGGGGGSGSGSGGGGTIDPVTPKVHSVVLRGTYEADGGAATVLVDGEAATLDAGTWRREVAIPDGGKDVVVQLSVAGAVVAERVLAIAQPQASP